MSDRHVREVAPYGPSQLLEDQNDHLFGVLLKLETEHVAELCENAQNMLVALERSTGEDVIASHDQSDFSCNEEAVQSLRVATLLGAYLVNGGRFTESRLTTLSRAIYLPRGGKYGLEPFIGSQIKRNTEHLETQGKPTSYITSKGVDYFTQHGNLEAITVHGIDAVRSNLSYYGPNRGAGQLLSKLIKHSIPNEDASLQGATIVDPDLIARLATHDGAEGEGFKGAKSVSAFLRNMEINKFIQGDMKKSPIRVTDTGLAVAGLSRRIFIEPEA